jgi:hypothetical protein
MPSRAPTGLTGWRFAIAVLLCVLSLATTPAHAADRSLEYAVKATFLYKFASFVEWPPGAFEQSSSPFHLCVVGADPFGGKIQEAVAGQSVGSHPIVLRQLARAEPRSGCHAMFVPGTASGTASGSQTAAETLNAVSGTPTLTVTDSAFGTPPGIIHFVIVDDRVSFDIDNVAAARNGLVISSKLLELAHQVHTSRARPIR